jgi:hypothetical protein
VRGKVIKELRRFARCYALVSGRTEEEEFQELKENWHTVKDIKIKGAKSS